MSTEAGAQARRRRSRKWWPAVGVALGALAGLGIFQFMPKVYRASSGILIVPQRVPEDFARSLVTASLGERLSSITQQILSRTRLERIIQEFDLYQRERQRMFMEDVIEQMRRDISVTMHTLEGSSVPVSFLVGFRSTDARTAMRVTERLASLFVQENLEDRSLRAEQTTQFLRTQAEEVRNLLNEGNVVWGTRGAPPRKSTDVVIDDEVQQELYRSLLRKLEEAKIVVNLERRQIGEQFRIIDGARLPERPVGPDWRPVLAWGAVGGLATSFLVTALSSTWRRRTMAEPWS